MKLLLVDDEVTMIQIMEKAIDWKKKGIQKVFVAYNADEARDILASSAIDIMICDIEMPGESGLELIQWMQDAYPEIICIILTGFPDFNYARSAISLGVYQYLLKPVSFEELEKVISSAIERVEENMAVSMKTPNEKDSEMSDPIRQVRGYLEEHYNEIITRRNIESLVHLNGDYINREFKKCTGYTLVEYIQRYRIIMAKKLLRETNLSMAEISAQTGYDSPAYFAKIFKKLTSQTPSEYRVRHERD